MQYTSEKQSDGYQKKGNSKYQRQQRNLNDMQSCRPENETFTENHFNFVPFSPPSPAPRAQMSWPGQKEFTALVASLPW